MDVDHVVSYASRKFHFKIWPYVYLVLINFLARCVLINR
jgi:hypothetical protein